jgi:hypothetical protein
VVGGELHLLLQRVSFVLGELRTEQVEKAHLAALGDHATQRGADRLLEVVVIDIADASNPIVPGACPRSA